MTDYTTYRDLPARRGLGVRMAEIRAWIKTQPVGCGWTAGEIAAQTGQTKRRALHTLAAMRKNGMVTSHRIDGSRRGNAAFLWRATETLEFERVGACEALVRDRLRKGPASRVELIEASRGSVTGVVYILKRLLDERYLRTEVRLISGTRMRFYWLAPGQDFPPYLANSERHACRMPPVPPQCVTLTDDGWRPQTYVNPIRARWHGGPIAAPVRQDDALPLDYSDPRRRAA